MITPPDGVEQPSLIEALDLPGIMKPVHPDRRKAKTD
jgi:hypothetical protein